MSDRRRFLQNTAALLAGGTLLSSFEKQPFAIFKNKIFPSGQLNIGAIGIKGMGWSNVLSALKIPAINLVALCDYDNINIFFFEQFSVIRKGFHFGSIHI